MVYKRVQATPSVLRSFISSRQLKAMKSLLVLFLCASVAYGHFKTGNNFCQDEKERHDTCKPLVSHEGCHCSHHGSHEGSKPASHPASHQGSNSHGSSEESGSGSGSGMGSGSGSGSSEESGSGSGVEGGLGSGSGSGSGGWEDGDYCFLLHIFWKFSLTLDIELQIIFQEWINVTQVTIVEDMSLTEYEILVKLYYSLQILFEEHIEIKTTIQFLYVGDWGYVCDLEGLIMDIQTANAGITIQEVITITGTSCPLTDALKECKHNASSTAEQVAIEQLITDIKVIIKGSYSFSLKMVLISQKFQTLLAQYPDLKILFSNSEILDFGCIKSFVDLCSVYYRIDNFTFAVGGSVSSCKLINALIAFYTNVSSGASTSERSDIKQLSDKCSTYFSTVTDVQLRVQYFTEQLYQMLILSEWELKFVYAIEIDTYGSLYQLIYSYIYCINNNVTQGDFTTTTTSTSTTTTTTKPTTTTTTTTTTKPTTTTSTTTTTTTTTTKPNGNCATVSSVNVVSANITLLLSAIDADQKTTHWNDTLIATFLGYKKKIYNYSINTTMSTSEKFNSIKTVLTGFTTKADFKAIVYAIFIQTWGTISQYCGCTM